MQTPSVSIHLLNLAPWGVKLAGSRQYLQESHSSLGGYPGTFPQPCGSAQWKKQGFQSLLTSVCPWIWAFILHISLSTYTGTALGGMCRLRSSFITGLPNRTFCSGGNVLHLHCPIQWSPTTWLQVATEHLNVASVTEQLNFASYLNLNHHVASNYNIRQLSFINA